MKHPKDLKHYLELDYNIKIQKEFYEDEFWYIAYSSELGKKSCYGVGSNKIEALQKFEENKKIFLSELYKKGLKIPSPNYYSEEQFSCTGVFNVRTSSELHTQLMKNAKEKGLSLNKYINILLSRYSALDDIKLEFSNRFEKLELLLTTQHKMLSNQPIFYIYEPMVSMKRDLSDTEEDLVYEGVGNFLNQGRAGFRI